MHMDCFVVEFVGVFGVFWDHGGGQFGGDCSFLVVVVVCGEIVTTGFAAAVEGHRFKLWVAWLAANFKINLGCAGSCKVCIK